MGAKKILLLIILVLVTTALVACWRLPRADAPTAVLTALQSFPQEFFVVRTEEVITDVMCDTGNFLLGPRVGHASIIMRIHLGVDVDKIGPEHIEVRGGEVVVTLPAVEVFDVSLDLATWRTHTQRSGFHVIGDAFGRRSLHQEMLQALHAKLSEYRTVNYKQRDQLIKRLNRRAARVFSGKGISVRFE